MLSTNFFYRSSLDLNVLCTLRILLKKFLTENQNLRQFFGIKKFLTYLYKRRMYNSFECDVLAAIFKTKRIKTRKFKKIFRKKS